MRLVGRTLVLEALTIEHCDALWTAAADPRIFEFAHGPRSLEELRAYVAAALQPRCLPFVVLLRDRVIGSTRLKDIDEGSRCCELGNTWFAPEFWRTGVNRESKLLMLTLAFEQLGLYRVELRVAVENQRSRESILRLGAVEEGVLRARQLLPDGRRRDQALFSILKPEWPSVKERLRRAPA
ncbi:MAG: N-acetyltransferase [Fimbriimonadaceae bacterium]|nr:N-acetyltransferase [Fimbriimonadaceae bacterium]